MRSSFYALNIWSILSSSRSFWRGSPLSSLSSSSSTLRNLTEFAKSLIGLNFFHSSFWCCYVLVFDLDRLNSLSISSSVKIFFLFVFVKVFCLLPVLLNLVVLFFHRPLEFIALRMCDTSPVSVVMAAPYLFLRLRPAFYLLCILTTIIIILF